MHTKLLKRIQGDWSGAHCSILLFLSSTEFNLSAKSVNSNSNCEFILNSAEKYSQNINHIVISWLRIQSKFLIKLFNPSCLTHPLTTFSSEFQLKFSDPASALLCLENSLNPLLHRHTPTANILMVALFVLCKISFYHHYSITITTYPCYVQYIVFFNNIFICDYFYLLMCFLYCNVSLMKTVTVLSPCLVQCQASELMSGWIGYWLLYPCY